MGKIETLLRTEKNIFTINDLRLFWDENNPDALKSAVKYYIDSDRLFSVKRGVYSVSSDFDPFEAAQSLISPSYITLQSALARNGIIFQEVSGVSSFAPYSRIIYVNNFRYSYHKVKDEILFNPIGIEKIDNYNIAGLERAICDTLYLLGEYYFDNLRKIDIEKLRKIARIYGKKSVIQRVEKIILTI